MRKLYFLLIALSMGIISNAQLTGTKNIPGDYADLAAAITDLNTQGVGSGGVLFNVVASNPQSAPAGGYVIGGPGSLVLTTSSSANPITIQGNNNTVTANAGLTAGALNDGIIKLIGADWVTISGFTLQENAGNTTTTAASNNMTEWGIALLYVTTTDGAQNNTIQNNTITLNRTYQNTFGIYSNSTHSATAVTTSASATSTAGGNGGLKIHTNNINNINLGIAVVGPTAAADFNNGVDIGGTAAGTGNTITNFGNTGTFSGYANVSGTVFGILVRNATTINVSYNTITSSTGAGGVTAGTLRGIYVPSFSATPTGTFTNNYNNNTLSISSYVLAGGINGISVEATTASLASTTNINANNFTTLNHTIAAATGTITALSHVGSSTAGPLTTNINNNTFTNLTSSSTGSFTFLFNSWTGFATSVKNVNNNSIVTGFTKTGAGGTVLFFTDNGSDPAGAINNSNNNTFSNISITGATAVTGLSNTNGGSPTKTVNGNIVSNISGGTTGAVIGIVVNFDGATTTANGNVVHTITNGGAITGISFGSTGAGVTNSSLNTVYALSGSGTGTVTGIANAGGNRNLFRNKVYNLENTNAAGAVSGITISAGTTQNVYNNLIGDLRAPALNATNSLIGLNITGGTTVNGYFNTVYLNALSSGALFGSSAIFASTTSTLTLRNNIFVNLSTPNGATGLSSAYRRSSTTLTSYATASNQNLFYAGTPGANNLIFYDGANSDQTLAAYKARVASRDAGSITENPNFVSTTGSSASFLHINTGIATQIESGGAAVSGITDDYDGDTRNATTPDIGADEFTGITIDLNPPTIVYTALANACSPGVRTLIANITDASGVPTTGVGLPVLYFRINAGAYMASQGTFISGSQYQFSLGTGTVNGDVVSYFIVAQDNSSTPNIGSSPSTGAGGFTANPPAAATPPTTPSSYSVVTPLSGTYTVGAGGNYTTLTAAVADYNTRCLAGAVVFNLTDATYTGETFPITIVSNNDASAINTLTIKPATGVNATLSATLGTSVLRLNGADYVIIDGSNNGTTSRNLTVATTHTSTSGNLIWVSSASALDSAGNNTIRNVILTGHSSVTTFSGITQSGTTLGGVAECQNNNNTYQNNLVTKTLYGIAAVGSNSFDRNTTIIGNAIGTSNVADTIGLNGIAVFQQQNGLVSQNVIQGVITTTTSTTSGIRTSGTANGVTISRNDIKRVRNTNTGGWGSNGIQLNNSSTAAGVTVVNNYISDIASYGYITGAALADNGYGIVLATGGGYNIYYNTVVLNTDQTVAGLPSGLNITSGITTAASVDVRNNHFINTQTIGGGGRYAIYSGAPNTVFSNINYNNYYSAGSNLGFIGTDRATVTDIQTGFGGNANSTGIQPVFVSATDLRLNLTANAALDNTGTPITGITTDFDNVGRSATTPDVGADEFTTGGTLPANLLTFSGLRAGTTNNLKWTVAQEIDVIGYDVERSYTGSTWERVGSVTSFGNTTSQRNYTFSDNNFTGLKQQYRLRILDRNAVQKLSNTIILSSTKSTGLMLSGLYPNPALDKVNLLVDVPAKDNVTIIVTDVAGRVVKAHKGAVGEGSNTLPLNIVALAKGSYFVKVICESNNATAVSQFVKE